MIHARSPALTRTLLINHVADCLGFRRYLEIGMGDPNANFNFINCEDKEAVDPATELPEPETGKLHRMGSDEFFAGLAKDAPPWELIFVDGLHTADQSFKDILHALDHLEDGGVILVHDVYPPEEWMTGPNPTYPGAPWCGDVWKMWASLGSLTNVASALVPEDYGLGVIVKEPFNSFFARAVNACFRDTYVVGGMAPFPQLDDYLTNPLFCRGIPTAFFVALLQHAKALRMASAAMKP